MIWDVAPKERLSQRGRNNVKQGESGWHCSGRICNDGTWNGHDLLPVVEI